MTVYNFGGLSNRFEVSSNDGGFIPNPVPGTEFSDQSWTQEGSLAIYPINVDYQNGWVSSIFVDGGNTSQNRDARLCVQTASFNQGNGSFEQGRSEKFADIPTYIKDSTELHPWQPYDNVWSFRNRKLKQTVAPGQCAFVMPSDDGNESERRADHLWLYLMNCDDGNISYTRHLIWSANESIPGVDPSADLSKNNVDWDLQVIDGAVIVYWTLTDLNLDNKSWLFSRSFDLDTQTVGTTNIVLEGTASSPGAMLYRTSWSTQVGEYVVVKIIDETGDWAPSLVVVDSLGAFVSSLSLEAEVLSYGSTSFTFPLSGMGLVKIDDTRLVSVVTIDHEDGRGVVVIDVAHDDGTLTMGNSLVIVDPTKTILSGEPTGIGAEPLPDGRVSVFTWDWGYYFPILHFFVVNRDVSSWNQDGEFSLSYDSDFAGDLGIGPAWGQHIGKWWAYLGRERFDEEGDRSVSFHGFPLAYYSISFGEIPSLRLVQRDDDNEFGSSRIERVQVSSAQKSGRIPGPNAYW